MLWIVIIVRSQNSNIYSMVTNTLTRLRSNHLLLINTYGGKDAMVAPMYIMHTGYVDVGLNNQDRISKI